MDIRYYILKGHEVAVTDEISEWGRCMDSVERFVGDTQNEYFRVSTAFLGVNHQYGKGPPILFETMVFIKPPYMDIVPQDESLDGITNRYSSWDDAAAGHESQVRRLTLQIETKKAMFLNSLSKTSSGALEQAVAVTKVNESDD